MKYRGYFSLLDEEGQRQPYCADFSVGYLESPGGCLRRLVYEEFSRRHALGLSIDAVEQIAEECMSGEAQIRRQACAQQQSRLHTELERAY